MLLTPPIQPGFRRPWTAKPDEPLDGPITAQVLAGDSTVTVNPDGLSGFFNGDGAIGLKSVDLVADGHLGTGVVEIRTNFQFEVAHPDATTMGITVGTTDETIPTPAP
jgi:hypothetical protein